jgi:hypothetical protein
MREQTELATITHYVWNKAITVENNLLQNPETSLRIGLAM